MCRYHENGRTMVNPSGYDLRDWAVEWTRFE